MSYPREHRRGKSPKDPQGPLPQRVPVKNRLLPESRTHIRRRFVTELVMGLINFLVGQCFV